MVRDARPSASLLTMRAVFFVPTNNLHLHPEEAERSEAVSKDGASTAKETVEFDTRLFR